jgi:hypothetical protein
MSRPGSALILAAVVGCSAAPLSMERGGPPPSGYTLVVTNEWTDMLAVAVMPQGPKANLYPGERRTLHLSSRDNARYWVTVQVGAHIYESGFFIPSHTHPCALLRIDHYPRYVVPTGPVPCESGTTQQGRRLTRPSTELSMRAGEPGAIDRRRSN